MALRWQDIDLEARSLRVRHTWAKGLDKRWHLDEPKSVASQRTVPLSRDAIAAFERQRARQVVARERAGKDWLGKDGAVFTNPAGLRISPTEAPANLRPTLERLGLHKWVLHRLRGGGPLCRVGHGKLLLARGSRMR